MGLLPRGVATAVSAVSIIRGPRATGAPNVRKQKLIKTSQIFFISEMTKVKKSNFFFSRVKRAFKSWQHPTSVIAGCGISPFKSFTSTGESHNNRCTYDDKPRRAVFIYAFHLIVDYIVIQYKQLFFWFSSISSDL